jgi:hypothetical protein
VPFFGQNFQSINHIIKNTCIFSRSPQPCLVFHKMCKMIPSTSNNRWNFNSRTVCTVYENEDELKECFEEFRKLNNSATVRAPTGLLHVLNVTDFLFWLSFFYRIMSHVDVLCDKLQSGNANSLTVRSAVQDFHCAISSIRNNIDIFVNIHHSE